MKNDLKRFGNSAVAVVLAAVMLLSTMVLNTGAVTTDTANALTAEEETSSSVAEEITNSEENTVTVDITPEDVQSSVLDANEIKQAEPEVGETAAEKSVKSAAPAKVLPKASGSFSVSNGNTIYFVNSKGWNNVYVYIWGTGFDTIDQRISSIGDTNVYKYTFSNDLNKVTGIIFKDTTGWVNQTEDISSVSDKSIYFLDTGTDNTNGGKTYTVNSSTLTADEMGITESDLLATSTTKQIGLVPVDFNWDNYRAYVWYESPDGYGIDIKTTSNAWPGVNMTATNGIYYANVPSFANRVLFAWKYGSDAKYQTGNIVISSDSSKNVFVPVANAYYNKSDSNKTTTGVWMSASDYSSSLNTEKTVYIDTTNTGWANDPYVHYRCNGTWNELDSMTQTDVTTVWRIDNIPAGTDIIQFTQSTNGITWGSGNESKTLTLSLAGHDNDMCFIPTKKCGSTAENVSQKWSGYWGQPAQYWPAMEDLTGTATNTSYYMYWGNSDTSFAQSQRTTFVQPSDKEKKVIKQQNDIYGNTWYYADFSAADIGTNCYFGLADGSGTPLNYSDNIKVSLSNSFVLGSGVQEINPVHFGKTWTLRRVDQVRIYVNSIDSSFNRYSVVVASQIGEGSVNVIAKDGTHRGNYKKFADLADTQIVAIDNDTVRTKTGTGKYTIGSTTIYDDYYTDRYNIEGTALAETAYIAKGTTITIRTTINDEQDGINSDKEHLRKKYYVKAFNINGETVWPTEKGVHSDGVYECVYTIPTTMTNDQLEITPVYFYNENTDEDNDRDYITFIVENFVGNVVTQWGKKVNGTDGTPILACYAWYGSGQDENNSKAENKPALGGYPGQPMVYENGHYIMQVPTLVDDGSHIQGITLNNYVWDFVHCDTQGAGNDGQREGINCQTYDYDDFVVLSYADPAPDFIVFRFKYETTKGSKTGLQTTDPTTDNPQAWGNQPSTNSFNADDYTNGWEDYDDYYGNTIDVFNNILKKKDGTVVSTKYNTNYKNSYFRIVSSGYRDIYYGHFATLWYIYDNNGNFVGKIPSSALYYQPSSGTSMPAKYTDAVPENITVSNVPTWFLPFHDGTTYNMTTNRAKNNDAQKVEYWTTYCKLYYGYNSSVSALDHPAKITYETAICAQDINSNDGQSGAAHKHPADPGLRNDGNWYYSKSGESFNAEIVIKYSTTSNLTNFNNTDSFVTEKSDKPYAGKVTGAHAYFTTESYTPNGLTTAIKANFYQDYIAENVRASKDNFTVAANQTSLGTDGKTMYEFKGWFIEYDGVESPLVTEIEDDKVVASAADMIGYTKLIAKYAPVVNSNTNDSVLTITHDLYKNAVKFGESYEVLNGEGTPKISVQVIDTNNNNAVVSEVPTYELNDRTVKIYQSSLSKYTASNYKLQVVLSVESDSTTEFNTTYLKTESESTSAGAEGVIGYTKYTINNTQGPDNAGTWTATKTASKTSGSAGTDTVTYTTSVADLFNNGTLQANTIKFYTQLTSTTVNVVFKYYDRDMGSTSTSQATDIAKKPSTFSITETLGSDGNNVAKLGSAVTNAVNDLDLANTDVSKRKINNVIDDYKFWATQSSAKTELALLAIPGTERGTKTLYDSEYTEYHTDYYSRQSNNPDYMKEVKTGLTNDEITALTTEKWVTYKDADGEEVTIADTSTDTALLNKVATVEVWGYNYPKQYKMTFLAYKLGDEYKIQLSNGEYKSTGLYFATAPSDSTVDNKDYNALPYYYNERVGAIDSNTNVNGVSDHLTAYGISQSSSATVVEAKKFTNYEFDGWYEYISDSKSYVKISSDTVYGNRVTRDATLVAGYKKADNSEITDKKGMAVVNNQIEKYVDSNGTQRVRYVTQLNTYGFDDSDDNFKSVSIIYIKLPADMNSSTAALAVSTLFADADFKEGIIAELDKGRTSTRSVTTALVVDVDSTEKVNDRGSVVYTYDIRPTYTDGTPNPDPTGNQIVFTNKNRGQFVLDIKEDAVSAGKASSNLLVLSAVKYKGDNVTTDSLTKAYKAKNNNEAPSDSDLKNELDKYLTDTYGTVISADTTSGYVYLASDNYVVYDNNTHTTAQQQ